MPEHIKSESIKQKRKNKLNAKGWMLLTVFATCIILTLTGIQYTNYVDRKTKSQWCSILTLIIEASKQIPENKRTSFQKDYFNEINKLYKDFRCTK